MSYKILLILVSFVVTGGLYAQTISGTIVEKETRQGLAGANITLFSSADSTKVAGTVSNVEGDFSIWELSSGNYYVEVSFIGFEEYSSPIFNLQKNKDFGKIPLSESSVLLNEVSLTSKVVNKIDKKVYPVAKNILSETGSASQILQNIPAVNVDVNGGISLRNAGVAIFLNGKPSAILQRNPAAFLEQLPAKMIEKIEVITNPSAKYKPDGVGGIINIVLKKERKKGVNGQLSGSAGFQQRYNGGLNLNYGSDAFNIFGNYGIRHSNRTYLFTDERIYSNASEDSPRRYFEDGRSTANNLSQTMYLGASWDMGDYNSAELSGNYFVANTDHAGRSSISLADASENTLSDFTNISSNDEHEAEGELQFALEHVFKDNEDHALALEASYASFNEKENQQFIQNYSIPNNATSLDNNLVQKSGNEEVLSLDYTLPISEDIEFEAGYEGEFSYQDIRYRRDQNNTRFLFNRNLHAVYAQYAQPIGDFSFKAGLRGEESYTKGEVKQPIRFTDRK